MILNIYDTEVANPLAAMIGDIDYDYQAEQWLIDCRVWPDWTNPQRWVVRAELVDSGGVRATWERPDGDAGYLVLTSAAPRFAGERGGMRAQP